MKDNPFLLTLLPVETAATSPHIHLYNHYIQFINDCLHQERLPWMSALPVNERPWAHLNTKQLLLLWEEGIFPLMQRYAYLPQDTEVRALKTCLDENQLKLSTLQQRIPESLLFRCQISREWNLPRQVDDLTLYAAPNVTGIKSARSMLSDDNRLIIYDMLIGAGFDKVMLEREVVSMVPKRSFEPLQSTQTTKRAITKIYDFSHQVCEALAIKRTIHSREPLSGFINKFTILPLSMLWKFRYLLYFMLSFAAYYIALQTLTIIGLTLLSEKLVTLLTSGLFYTLALFPLWCFVGQTLKQSLHRWCEKWRAPKEAQILEALCLLEKNEQWIQYRLNQVILDLAHIDVGALDERIFHTRAKLQEIKAQLNKVNLAELAFCSPAIIKQAAAISEKLSEQEADLKQVITKLIQHINSRVKEELTLLIKDLSTHALTPLLPTNQYHNLKAFVVKFGKNEDLAVFEKEANILQLWLANLNGATLAENNQRNRQRPPWGTAILRPDFLKGWHHLLNQLLDNSSAQVINKWLLGEKTLSLSSFMEHVASIEKATSSQTVLGQLQDIVFNTLSERDASIASLLSLEQKNLIATWYFANKNSIEKANIILARVFAKQDKNYLGRFSNKQLAYLFKILDGAAIYYFSQGEIAKGHLWQNKIRQYFANYNGASSRVLKLLRFVSDQQVTQLQSVIAEKRLAWIVSHLNQGIDPNDPFDEDDLDFFLSHRLSKQHEMVNLNQIIHKTPEYIKPWSATMHRFLVNCRRYGLDSGNLVADYQMKKDNNTEFALQYFKQKIKISQPKQHKMERKDHARRKNLMRQS